MPSEIREWSVPAPVRALLWWPAIAFVAVIAFPDASVGLIMGAGLALATLGVLVPMAARRRWGRVAAVPTAAETTVEFPTLEMPGITDERAA